MGITQSKNYIIPRKKLDKLCVKYCIAQASKILEKYDILIKEYENRDSIIRILKNKVDEKYLADMIVDTFIGEKTKKELVFELVNKLMILQHKINTENFYGYMDSEEYRKFLALFFNNINTANFYNFHIRSTICKYYNVQIYHVIDYSQLPRW